METHQTAHNATNAEGGPPRVSPLTVSGAVGEAAVRVNVAAKLAGVCRRTIYAWISRGLVDVRYSPSGAVLVVVSSLVREERPAGVGRGNPRAAEPRQPRVA